MTFLENENLRTNPHKDVYTPKITAFNPKNLRTWGYRITSLNLRDEVFKFAKKLCYCHNIISLNPKMTSLDPKTEIC